MSNLELSLFVFAVFEALVILMLAFKAHNTVPIEIAESILSLLNVLSVKTETQLDDQLTELGGKLLKLLKEEQVESTKQLG